MAVAMVASAAAGSTVAAASVMVAGGADGEAMAGPGMVGVDRMAIAGGAAVTIRMAVMDIRIDYASPIAN